MAKIYKHISFHRAKYQHTVYDLMPDNIDVSITDCICNNVSHTAEQKPILHTTSDTSRHSSESDASWIFALSHCNYNYMKRGRTGLKNAICPKFEQ